MARVFARDTEIKRAGLQPKRFISPHLADESESTQRVCRDVLRSFRELVDERR